MDKKVILFMAGVGGAIGGYVPTLFGSGALSGWSLLGAFLGGVLGIWAGIKLSDY